MKRRLLGFEMSRHGAALVPRLRNDIQLPPNATKAYRGRIEYARNP